MLQFFLQGHGDPNTMLP